MLVNRRCDQTNDCNVCSYTYVNTRNEKPTWSWERFWDGHCLGRSNYSNTHVYDIHATSGVRLKQSSK